MCCRICICDEGGRKRRPENGTGLPRAVSLTVGFKKTGSVSWLFGEVSEIGFDHFRHQILEGGGM